MEEKLTARIEGLLRATSVVRLLSRDYGVNPLQIQPCGRGEFMPVADNSAAEERSLNRRIDIIMAPKIDKLLEVLKINLSVL